MDRASAFSFTTFQIFSKNQMQWKSKPFGPEDVEKFRHGVISAGMSSIMIHASYLLNMGSVDPVLRAKVLDAFKEEIRRADELGVDLLTFHPGSAGDGDRAISIKTVGDNLNSVISKDQKVRILLETSAGQGRTVGSTFEELAEMLDEVELKGKVGICFDTCHVWASGYDIRSAEGYSETMDRFNSVLGFKNLGGFHLNDSKKGMGSRVDRHEQIGDGTLGVEGISNFVKDRRFWDRPLILETPLGEQGYAKDLEKIHSMLKD
ncbi:MAG: deoxyribonuclease IV [Candidatus Thermoplasmatota archaeon]|nr:deoxyribonuclease IV [Candidatus Thermoplasmatota archaeon]